MTAELATTPGTRWSAPRVSGLGHLLAPRRIAVAGASERNFYTGNLLRRLAKNQQVEVIPVNPNRDTVYGRPAVPTLADVEGGLDLVVVGLRAGQVLATLEQAVAAGAPTAIVISGGFAESAEGAGRQRQDALAGLVAETGLRVLGPSCLGAINAHAGIEVFAGHQGPAVIPGGLGVVSQSGANCHSFIYGAWRRAVGLSYVVSTGNEADVRATDVMAHLLDDPATGAIAAFLEQIQDIDAFEEVAARSVAVGKPLLVMKVGRTAASARAALAHTGAAPGTDAVFDALFTRYGVIRASTVDQLLDIAAVAVGERWRTAPATRRVYVMSVAGGSASAVADLLDDYGLQLPPLAGTELRAVLPANVTLHNPMDISTEVRRRSPEAWRAVATALAEAGNGDWVLVVEASPLAPADRTHLDDLVKATGCRVVCVSMGDGLRLWSASEPADLAAVAEWPVPVVRGLRAAVEAMAAMVTFGSARAGGSAPAAVRHDAAFAEAVRRLRQAPAVDGVAGEAALGPVLDSLGISRPRQLISADPAALAEFAVAQRLSSVVLKGAAAGVAHKTELGLVRLGVRGPEAIARAACDIQQRMAALAGTRPPYEVMLQEQVDGLAELVVSASRLDAGRVVMTVGWGGRYVELLDRSARRLAPLRAVDVEAMLAQTRLAPLFAGYRSAPPGDFAALCRLLAAIGGLATAAGPALVEFELNPVVVRPAGQGVVAVDAMARVAVVDEGGPDV